MRAALQKPPAVIVVIAMKIVLNLHQNDLGDRRKFRHAYDEDQSDLHHDGDDSCRRFLQSSSIYFCQPRARSLSSITNMLSFLVQITHKFSFIVASALEVHLAFDPTNPRAFLLPSFLIKDRDLSNMCSRLVLHMRSISLAFIGSYVDGELLYPYFIKKRTDKRGQKRSGVRRERARLGWLLVYGTLFMFFERTNKRGNVKAGSEQ